MSTRRQFLQSLSLLAAGLAMPSVSGNTPSKSRNRNMETGIQLWTLKELIGADLISTLQALSEIGYTSIEPYGFDGNFFGLSPREFSKISSDMGIAIHSTHTNITDQNAAFLAENAAEAGLEYLIMPSMMGRPEKSIDDFLRTAEEMNRIGEICRQFNICFGYHNHDFEFRTLENQIPYDVLLKETDPELVSFQMDIYWIRKAGFDPFQYFSNHAGRFQTWHIKDMGHDGKSCIVGNGVIDFKALMLQSGQAGLRRIFVEQEQFSEGSPLYCVKQSYRYIQSNL